MQKAIRDSEGTNVIPLKDAGAWGGADCDLGVASEIPEISVRPWCPIGKLELIPLILEFFLVNVKFGAEGY